MAAPNRRSRTVEEDPLWWSSIPGEGHITKLNASNYDEVISQSNKPIFVMFYAQWCGYSTQARNAFAAAAEQLASEENPVVFGAINGDVCLEIRDRYFQITGYPSFLYFVHGSLQRMYFSERSKEGFYNWIIKIQNM